MTRQDGISVFIRVVLGVLLHVLLSEFLIKDLLVRLLLLRLLIWVLIKSGDWDIATATRQQPKLELSAASTDT